MKAPLFDSCLYWLRNYWNRPRILVWFASIIPDTLCGVSMYGLRFERATYMLAGPQGMKLASFLSLIRCKDLCTCVGSTSPWMMFKIDM